MAVFAHVCGKIRPMFPTSKKLMVKVRKFLLILVIKYDVPAVAYCEEVDRKGLAIFANRSDNI